MQQKLQPALLGGLFIGVLSALPVVNAGNCCCLWVIGGGVVAAYLLQQSQSTPVTSGDGAVVGLMSGVIGAVVTAVISLPIKLMLGPLQARWMERIAQQSGDNPDVAPFLRMMEGGGGAIIGTIITFGFMLFLGMIFSTLGGLLGATLFRKNVPPPPSPPPPPPPPAGFGEPFNPPPLQ